MRTFLVFILFIINGCSPYLTYNNKEYRKTDFSNSNLYLIPAKEEVINVDLVRENIRNTFKVPIEQAESKIRDVFNERLFKLAVKYSKTINILDSNPELPADFSINNENDVQTNYVPTNSQDIPLTIKNPNGKYFENIDADYCLFINGIKFDLKSNTVLNSSTFLTVVLKTKYSFYDIHKQTIISAGEVEVEMTNMNNLIKKDYISAIDFLIVKMFLYTPFRLEISQDYFSAKINDQSYKWKRV